MRRRWTKSAREDLRGIREWIGRDRPGAAARIAQRIEKDATSLTRFPRLGRETRHSGIRVLLVAGTPYLLYYSVIGQVVYVLRVVHGAQEGDGTAVRPV